MLIDMPRIDAYATHLPLLAACVANTSGPVIELGCGLYSTPLLHALCLNRLLLSLESDSEWIKRFQHLASAMHRVVHVIDWAAAPLDGQWSVALIDQQPAAARVRSIERLRGHVDLFIVHDTEHRLYCYEQVLTTFPYRIESQRNPPWTSVVSDTQRLRWLESLL